MRKLLRKDKDSKSPAPASKNPYAQQGTDPYTAKSDQLNGPSRSASAATQPPSYSPGPLAQPPREKTPVPPGGYGSSQFGGQNGHRGYGSHTGYGPEATYGSRPEPSTAPSSRYGPGGYGGLGRSNSQDTMSTEAGREALFGDAGSRAQQQQQMQAQAQLPPDNGPGGGYNASNGYGAESGAYGGGSTSQGYGKYEDRVLSPEEEEEEDVKATKDQIRFLKQSDVASTRNALRVMAQSEEAGRDTLARLGAQGERIHNTEKNLDLASNQNRLAEEKARELKTLNRSMFAMHASNPFTKGRRQRRADEDIMDKHWEDRERREATRRAAYQSQSRQAEHAKDLRGGAAGTQGGSKSLAERSKYQFEADSEDEEMENEIDTNLEQLAAGAGRLNQLSRAMGSEVDEQNKHIDRIMEKTDRVDDQIAMNRARLDRIGR